MNKNRVNHLRQMFQVDEHRAARPSSSGVYFRWLIKIIIRNFRLCMHKRRLHDVSCHSRARIGMCSSYRAANWSALTKISREHGCKLPASLESNLGVSINTGSPRCEEGVADKFLTSSDGSVGKLMERARSAHPTHPVCRPIPKGLKGLNI